MIKKIFGIALPVLLFLSLTACSPLSQEPASALMETPATELPAAPTETLSTELPSIPDTPASESPSPEPTPTQPLVKQVEDMEITVRLNFEDGSYTGQYTGDMLEGMPHGQGKFITVNSGGTQLVYTGGWNAGHLEGDGQWEFRGILLLEGNFENDLIIAGKMYDRSGQLFYEGEFRDGLRVEDEAAIQARIDSYNEIAVPYTGGSWADYIGQLVTVERELVEVEQRAGSVEFHLLQPSGDTSSITYYPAYGEVLPQGESRLLAYYLVTEGTSESGERKGYTNLVAYVPL